MIKETELLKIVDQAVERRELRGDAAGNIRRLILGDPSEFYLSVITELATAGHWAELSDRFYKTLAFGTGGLRGRTIGKVVTVAERGTPTALGRPEFPCVGTNAMNYVNVARATRGLVSYVQKWRRRHAAGGRAKIVIAHDIRHFSSEFADLSAKVASEAGCDAVAFSGPRSTPELSFAVRYLNADAGIVITASHNPPYDNGYKVYFSDGAQVVEPHASGIIAEVNAGPGEAQSAAAAAGGELVIATDEIDQAYIDRLCTLVLDRQLFSKENRLKVVYTPLHGTGSVIIKPLFTRVGVDYCVVPEQDEFDGRFPTVKSPNPENAEALKLGIELATKTGADLVVATDPDCDRIGVAVRTRDGEMKLLTGNQIGSVLAWYRARTMFERGILNKENASRAVIIKTFVTTDLQKAIAERFGLRCVETLTGFKYIGAKLGKYEQAIGASDYRRLSEEETRKLRLEKSSFYVFGGEESYGYSGADFVRDKDGSGAALMFCEVAAYAKARGITVDELLDEIFCECGYFEEKNGSFVLEGADGAEKIRRLLISYEENPPRQMLDCAVISVRNFARDQIRDADGDEIPKEKMLIFELADQTRIAVRASGTEPKIKYYLFGRKALGNSPSGHSGNQMRTAEGVAGGCTRADVQLAKREVGQRLNAIWEWLHADATERLTK